MPIYRYSGYRTDGAEVTGAIEANSPREAALRLKESGLYPRHISESVTRERRGLFRRPDPDFLPAVTRQLSVLLASGVPLMEALNAVGNERSGFHKSLMVRVKERIASGASFSKALSEESGVFPEFYVNMVAAGETSGALDKVLGRLADFLEAQSAIKAKVRTSMIYPIFMICVGFVVLSFLFAFVIPKVTRIFKDTHAALPFLTVLLIWISEAFQRYWWMVLAAILGGAIGVRRLREKKRLLVDRFMLRLPGKILQSLYCARFTRTLGFLLEGGLPVLRALELAGKSVGNAMLEGRITDAARKVAEGARLSASLDGFPPVLTQLISTGERSGQLAAVLRNAADAYEEEFSRRVQKAIAFLEPAMILAMGCVVGLIVLAVLLPIFQLNQLIK